jgi:hypothetical protein
MSGFTTEKTRQFPGNPQISTCRKLLGGVTVARPMQRDRLNDTGFAFADFSTCWCDCAHRRAEPPFGAGTAPVITGKVPVDDVLGLCVALPYDVFWGVDGSGDGDFGSGVWSGHGDYNLL